VENEEPKKYLMTFQNLLSRIHKWNNAIIEEERKRIIEKSGCNYLEDLITCVHIIQLKVMTCIRVGNKQKKIDITIPRLDDFLHKVYIHVARKVYSNVYLFEKNIPPLQQQKHHRELESIVQECIMTAIRESIPTEAIIRSYLDETMEQEEEVIIEPIAPTETKDEEKVGEEEEEKAIELPEETPPPIVPIIENLDEKPVITTTNRLSFGENDRIMEYDKEAPPVETTTASMETTSPMMTEPRFSSSSSSFMGEDDDDDDILKFSDEEVKLEENDFDSMDF